MPNVVSSLFTFRSSLYYQRHAWSETFQLGDRTSLHLEGLAVVVAIILGGFPCGVRTLVLQVIYLHLDFLAEGWNEGGKLIALVEPRQVVFTHIEGSPHITHDRDTHNGRPQTHQFAYLGIDIADLAFALCYLNSFLQ